MSRLVTVYAVEVTEEPGRTCMTFASREEAEAYAEGRRRNDGYTHAPRMVPCTVSPRVMAYSVACRAGLAS